MMATKPRPAEESAPVAIEEKKPATSAEAIQDLERRLMGLGGDEEDKKEESPSEAADPAADVTSAAAAAAPAAAAPEKTAAPESGGGKGALLARIMAAQERARAAQEKQQKLEASLAAHDRKDHIMKALEGKEEEEGEEPPPPFEVAEKAAPPPPAFDAAALPPPAAEAAAPPAFGAVENSLPPSFAAVENTLPPSFDAMERTIPPPVTIAPVAAPSAPSLDLHHEAESAAAPAPPAVAEHNLLHEGIENVLAPPPADATAPPSFEQIENQLDEQLMDDEAFMLGEDGKPLSAEERRKMMEEQRAIMAAIQKESADNAAAIAAAQAEAFDQRSGSAVARVAGGGPPPREAERAALVGHEDAGVAGDDDRQRTVSIGEGQNVALHGQERTKRAIADGTAILVECMNCNNWMQVTESATLMFCPVCSVVSPVQKQSEVSTKEEAIQLTRDRQMAERLQAEINAELGGDGGGSSSRGSVQRTGRSTFAEGHAGPGFLAGLMGESSSSSGASRPAAGAPASKSWWDTISEYVSVGVSSQEPRHGDIGVSRPPGSGGAATASTDRPRASPSNVERQGLLNATVDRNAGVSSSPPAAMARGGGGGMQAARVAESKPLFSCIADSISSAATAMGETLTSTTLSSDAEGNVHGVDSSGLLVTNAGRQGGSYHQISDRES